MLGHAQINLLTASKKQEVLHVWLLPKLPANKPGFSQNQRLPGPAGAAGQVVVLIIFGLLILGFFLALVVVLVG